jgi:hypothetical protein
MIAIGIVTAFLHGEVIRRLPEADRGRGEARDGESYACRSLKT